MMEEELQQKSVAANSHLIVGSKEQTHDFLSRLHQETLKRDERAVVLYKANEVNSLRDFYFPLLEELCPQNTSLLNFARNYDHNPLYNGIMAREVASRSQPCSFLFVDGIEELFFRLDFPKGLEDNYKKQLEHDDEFNSFARYYSCNDFALKLSYYLDAPQRVRLFGTIHDENSLAYQQTLGNKEYPLNRDFFHIVDLKEKI